MQIKWYTTLFLPLAMLGGLGHAPAVLAQACTSAGTGNWTTPATWNAPCNVAGGPTANNSVTIQNGHTVTVTLAGGAVQAGALTIAGGATATGVTLLNNLTVTNAMGGVLNTGNVIINGPTAAVTKQIAVGASPNILAVTGNVTILGGSVTASANNIAQLAITSGRVNIGGNLTINGGTVQSNTRVTLTTGRIDVTGNATLTGGGAANQDALLSVTAAPAVAGNGINITGNLTTVATFAASSNVTLGAGSVVTVTGNVTNGDTLTVGGGTFTANGATFATTAVGNSATTSVTTGTLIIAGNATVNASTTVNSTSTMTVSTGRISVTGDLTVTGGNNAALRNALLSVTGVPAVAGNGVNVNGTLSTVLGGGAVTSASISITAANGVVNANGNFTNNGTFTNNAVAGQLLLGGATSTINGSFVRGTGTVTMDGGPPLAVTQALSGTALTLLPAANGFNNLTINNTTGFGVTLGSTVAVKGTLALTNGVVATGANTLDVTTALCAAPSVTRTNGWVSGNLQKRIPANASVCTFEVGGTSAYTPITATFIAGAAASSITAKSTDGDHASIATSGLDPSLTVNRFWSLTSTVAEATAFSAVFNFVAGDLDTDTAPTSANFVAKSFSGAAWSTPAVGARGLTSTTLTGLTLALATQKDFALGELARTAGTGSFNAVENLADPITGKIFTKLAGIAFTLDLVALNAARTAIDTTFKGAVIVDLLDSSDNTGALDATTGCRPVGAGAAKWHIIQTIGNPQFLAADLGRKQNVSFTESNAWPDARIRITYPTSGAVTLTGCSNDNFTIRPTSITSVASNMTNAATSGTPRAIAGSGTFDLTADTGLTGYTGTPKIDNTAVQAHASAIQNGSVSGTFPAAVSGTSTGTGAFTYSEVGNFQFLGTTTTAGTASGVYDDTFTTVDGASDCTADFSNVLVGGKYGCKFGITADAGFFGRFYPANFVLAPGTLTNRRIAACAPASSFTYAGEQFRVTFTLTAKNGAATPATTQNYDPAAGFASFDAATIANLNFGAVDLADATPPLTATALTASLTLGTSSGTWASGAVTVTADLMLTRAAAPNGPFESFKLGIDPADADGVKLSSYDLDTTVPADTNDHGLVGTSIIRYGRLRLQNANGSQLISMPIPISAQYWNGSGFITNTDDNCTTIAVGNIAIGNPQPVGFVIGAPTVGGTFNSGVGSLRLPKPAGGARGSVDVAVNLTNSTTSVSCTAGLTSTAGANMAYLQGLWCTPPGTYTSDPTARATFGTYRNTDQFIYQRENF